MSADPERPGRAKRPCEMVVGLTVPQDFPEKLCRGVSAQLPVVLSTEFPETSWRIVVRREEFAGPGMDVDLTQLVRGVMLEEGWDLGVCLTARPLKVGRRPVTAEASACLGIGIVSIPALGVLALPRRVLDAVRLAIEAILRTRDARTLAEERHHQMKRIEELGKLSTAVGQPFESERGTIAFATAAAAGHLRLLLGTIRGNRPWALIVGLSRSLVAAVATSVFGLTSPVIWRIAAAMKFPRMGLLSAGALFSIGFTLVLSHNLWEHCPTAHARTRVVLINLATFSTVGLGILTSYVALLMFNLLMCLSLVPRSVLQIEMHRPAESIDYLRIAWLISSLATFGGALGAVLEANDDVRAATFALRHVKNRNGGPTQAQASATEVVRAKSGP